jgi:hypothetical protein
MMNSGQDTTSQPIIHVFGHANGVVAVKNLLKYFEALPIEYHTRREDLERISLFKKQEIWLVVVKQTTISPVIFGTDGDFPEIEEPEKFDKLRIIFVPANKQAKKFFTCNWKKELIAAQPILSHFEDRIYLLDTVLPGKGLATLQQDILAKRVELTTTGVLLRCHPLYGSFDWKPLASLFAQSVLPFRSELVNIIPNAWPSSSSPPSSVQCLCANKQRQDATK